MPDNECTLSGNLPVCKIELNSNTLVTRTKCLYNGVHCAADDELRSVPKLLDLSAAFNTWGRYIKVGSLKQFPSFFPFYIPFSLRWRWRSVAPAPLGTGGLVSPFFRHLLLLTYTQIICSHASRRTCAPPPRL